MAYNPELRAHFHHDAAPPGELQPSRWIPMTRTLFKPDTIGYILFPEKLEGRLRPETIFDQPLALLASTPHGILSHLENPQIQTVRDILKLDSSTFFAYAKRIKSKDTNRKLQLTAYLESLVVLPHARLLERIFQQASHVTIAKGHEYYLAAPVLPPEYEAQVRNAVDEQLPTLDPVEARVVSLMYGLYDGTVMSYKNIAKRLNISSAKVIAIHERACAKLAYKLELKGYSVFSKGSIAQEAGVIFRKDLPSIDDIARKVSSATRREMDTIGDPYISFLEAKNRQKLSKKAQEELIQLVVELNSKEAQKQKIRSFIEYAKHSGRTTPEEIALFLEGQNLTLLGHQPRSLIGEALIKYALDYSEEK